MVQQEGEAEWTEKGGGVKEGATKTLEGQDVVAVLIVIRFLF